MRLHVDSLQALLTNMAHGEYVARSFLRSEHALDDAQLDDNINTLRDAQLVIDTETPQMLRLTVPLDVLDPERFVSAFPDHVTAKVDDLFISTVCTTTSDHILSNGPPQSGRLNVAVSEYQVSGLGRQGRAWKSGLADGICFSVCARLPAGMRVAPSLTLALGVKIAEVLDQFSHQKVLLKWPNDLIMGDGKLGGILVKLSQLTGGDQQLLVGVGVNLEAPQIASHSAGLPAIAPAGLRSFERGAFDRTLVAAALIAAVVDGIKEHRTEGFVAFRRRWNQRDYLAHQHVQVFEEDRVRNGTAQGVDELGALQVSTSEGLLHLMSGEVRVRKQHAR